MRTFVVSVLALVTFAAACGSPPPAEAPIAPGAIDAGAVDSAPPEPTVKIAAPEDDLALPVRTTDPAWGDRNAYVTIVEFAELQCPFCAKASQTIRALETKYGPDVLRVVWKHEPLAFHARARAAAEASQGAFALGGEKAFWSFVDAAFAAQNDLSDEAFRKWASAAGIDEARFRSGLASHAWGSHVDADHALAKAIGVSGTPTFFINGAELGGAQPEAKFVAIIDEQLAKAKAYEQKGTPRDRIYAVASAETIAAHPLEPRKETVKEDTTTVFHVPVGKAPVRGNATALVTILEFGDFQCPFTKRVEDTLEKIRAAYGDKVRIVWMDEPLSNHTEARPAAKLAREARAQKGDAGFWAVHDALLASAPALADDDFKRIAAGAGLDVTKAMAALRGTKYEANIVASEDLVDAFQAVGTPHFFINGRRLVGAQPFDKFRMIIDEEVVHAEALLAKGTKPAALYEALVHDGKPPTDLEKKTIAIPVAAPSKGNADAAVVIQQFGDFECPFCARTEATLEEVRKKYGSNVRLVWRDFPLPMHHDAELAAEAAREVMAQRGLVGFWKAHDHFLSEAKTPNGLSRPELDRYAADIGLDMNAWAAALNGHKHAAAIASEIDVGHAAGITGTPGFLIGSYFIAGAQPLSKFTHVIDRVLREEKGRAKRRAAASAPWDPLVVPPPAPVAAAAPAAPPAPAYVPVGPYTEAQPGRKVVVHYVGHLSDGTEFDSSRKRGQPFSFVLGRGNVIKGWEQGLVGMKVGERRVLTVPPELGYGERGMPPTIPPSATLVFDVELLDVQQP